MPPLPDIVPPVILPDVVPVPPAAPAVAMALSQPDFVSDASNGTKPNDRSALLESIRNFKGGTLRKVEQEPKPKVISSDGGDVMSQLYDTLESMRQVNCIYREIVASFSFTDIVGSMRGLA